MGDSVGIFLAEHPQKDGYRAGVGSGFVGILGLDLFVITAAHVLEEVKKCQDAMSGD